MARPRLWLTASAALLLTLPSSASPPLPCKQAIKDEANGTLPPAPRSAPHPSILRLVTHCIAALFTLQQCTSDAVSPPVVEVALDAALRLLQPHAAANAEGFAAVTRHVLALKGLLAGKA